MKNFILFVGILTILVIVGGLLISSNKDGSGKTLTTSQPADQVSAPQTHEYYWSETCPHCANVAKFMDAWEGKDKFELNKFEVSKSNVNATKFLNRGVFCKIPQNQLGVPLMVTPEGECITGDEPIIEYLGKLEL